MGGSGMGGNMMSSEHCSSPGWRKRCIQWANPAVSSLRPFKSSLTHSRLGKIGRDGQVSAIACQTSSAIQWCREKVLEGIVDLCVNRRTRNAILLKRAQSDSEGLFSKYYQFKMVGRLAIVGVSCPETHPTLKIHIPVSIILPVSKFHRSQLRE